MRREWALSRMKMGGVHLCLPPPPSRRGEAKVGLLLRFTSDAGHLASTNDKFAIENHGHPIKQCYMAGLLFFVPGRCPPPLGLRFMSPARSRSPADAANGVQVRFIPLRGAYAPRYCYVTPPSGGVLTKARA